MANHKILVIDDSRVIRMRVKEMLPPGIEILEAKDGVEGLELILSEKPGLILLDFLLPRMSGWEVYQEVQKQPELQAIPLVLMSGRKEEVAEKITEPFQYFSFVEKPFDKEQLIEAIKDARAKAASRRVNIPASTSQTATAAAVATASSDSAAMSAEIQKLNQKVAAMQTEINLLKKQLAQLVGFIKQKLSK